MTLQRSHLNHREDGRRVRSLGWRGALPARALPPGPAIVIRCIAHTVDSHRCCLSATAAASSRLHRLGERKNVDRPLVARNRQPLASAGKGERVDGGLVSASPQLLDPRGKQEAKFDGGNLSVSLRPQ